MSDTDRPAVELLQLPDELFLALGEVAARYGQCEHLFAVTIKRATDGMSYEEAISRVKTLVLQGGRDAVTKAVRRAVKSWAIAKHEEGETREIVRTYDSLLGAWKKHYDRRDDVIHGVWAVDERSGKAFCTRDGECLAPEGRPFDVEDLKALADGFTQLVYKLDRLVDPTFVPGANQDHCFHLDRFDSEWRPSQGMVAYSTAGATVSLSRISASDDEK
ncbi:hypothetical protein [Pelagibius marinus]|uniref:hypothetical protein n=1 Tax=Pelagibius marinus TaxID=2762760 RepID=UPI001872AAD0|nr:hypothetical protein [Pelagibius marinus]